MMAGREVCMEFECTLLEDEGEEEQRWLGEVLVKSRSIYMAELLIYGRGSRMDAVTIANALKEVSEYLGGGWV